ncbi:glycerophosphodiester phosphodiesterase [Legionella jordanis]|uniref:Glycerophosphoryl diester phosphodiesterase n=1 Tax=Legionella jordanis TaxID=456 RepID=A0A0W0VDL0_9GAMM|nr:glycerophosphodiester phosphodiesterase family protein [Legionella jordanis]KTD17965.1 glycerophosphoryl diester phosphodiesterase [Legionella jordanis]RMX02343.1 glycerophosphodiester phosphodiesterase [Legionella jordanis]RMX15777.1 glycerophosphodiester phosphodiesterase [Legionella jordanis]VEH13943.1 glycerophosphoryl diester phosphodiesterase [Legionella jordanis]
MTFLDILQKAVDYCFALMPRKRPDLSKANLIAHRGVHDNKQVMENTEEAFELALKAGCWGIELDVQETADHVLVVNHDPTLKRLWGKELVISKLSFEEIRNLVPNIMSLAEVVNKYGKRMHLFIELKAPFHAEEELARIVSSLSPCKDYHLLSLDESIFATLNTFPKQALLLVAGPYNVKKFCELSLQKQYGGVLGHYLLLNKNRIRHLQTDEKQMIGVGFIDSRFGLYRELNRGVYWLFSNNIPCLLRALKQYKNSTS